jgi:hypothetical protein
MVSPLHRNVRFHPSKREQRFCALTETIALVRTVIHNSQTIVRRTDRRQTDRQGGCFGPSDSFHLE